jgi:hypothetical protein
MTKPRLSINITPIPPFSASIMFDGMKDQLIGKNSKDFAGYRIMDKHGEIQRVKTTVQKDKILGYLRDKYGRK